MFVTALMLSKEIGCSPKTILAHVRVMEREGYQVRAKIGRPAKINRSMFMRWVYGDSWRDEEVTDEESL